MSKDLKKMYALTEQQLLLIQRYFMSGTSDNENEADEWIRSGGNDSSGMDTEDEAGVIDWTDFDSFDVVDTNDPRPALIRKESKDFKKTAKNSRWLQGSLISAVGRCKACLGEI
uniref:DDE_Tnp_1_7 domain-containing protein n=1 Tax=Elaeophora elaphi TaxID=1147741 RepID=A0A0R3RXX2_9BILA